MKKTHVSEIVKTCVVDAGKILLDYFGRVDEVSVKESHSSVVTAADLAAEAFIVQTLMRAFPAANVIAEESGFIDKGSDFTWVVDPLDGTSNFAAGLPWFGVLVALLKGNMPVAGAAYLPCTGALYYAEVGQGVTRNGTRVHVTPETDLRNVLCAYGLDASSDETKTQREAAALARLANGVRNVRMTNSLLDFCYTVDGRLGACVNQNTKIWDIAPIILMLAEAGGLLTDVEGRALNLAVGADYDRSYAVIGASLALHPQILRLIA
jgi:myo-inositol-1(or 4)-monophosphatase